ncbi:hypothetical protein M0R45_035822 [Rubus argutus]|uniref:Uncharacterized protein n=1 Tax=Rubus argutus TaxID=59490 RepID=A0AAW1VYI8_RUBAR
METIYYVGVDQTRYDFILKEKPQKRNAGRGETRAWLFHTVEPAGGLEREDKKEKEHGSNGGDEMGKNQQSIFNNKWSDLLLDSNPNNILVVGLTELLTWVSVQVLWQLLFISLAILVAALKYSFVAAVFLFILDICNLYA